MDKLEGSILIATDLLNLRIATGQIKKKLKTKLKNPRKTSLAVTKNTSKHKRNNLF